MDGSDFKVVVSTGTLRPDTGAGIKMPHRWTSEGVVVQCEFTGAHLFHLAAAGCVLNDLYREAQRLGIQLDGARVHAFGGFNLDTWMSTGVEYEVEVASAASDAEIMRVVRVVDEVAEIPKALRSGTTVVRRSEH
jgi:uncharacterized OsmC-like protein